MTRRERASLSLAGLRGKVLTVHFSSGGARIDPGRFFKICSETDLNQIAIIQNGKDFTRRIGTGEALARIRATQLFEFGWKTHPYLLAYSYFNPECNSFCSYMQAWPFGAPLPRLAANLLIVPITSGAACGCRGAS